MKKRLFVLILAIITILMSGCINELPPVPAPSAEKYSVYKTEDGWRFTIEGFEYIRNKTPSFSSLENMKYQILNDDFGAFKEYLLFKGVFQHTLPKDEQGRLYMYDFDNLMQPVFPDNITYKDNCSWTYYGVDSLDHSSYTGTGLRHILSYFSDDIEHTSYVTYFFSEKEKDLWYETETKKSNDTDYWKDVVLVLYQNMNDQTYYFDYHNVFDSSSEYTEKRIDAVIYDYDTIDDVYLIQTKTSIKRDDTSYVIYGYFRSEKNYDEIREYTPMYYDIYVQRGGDCFLYDHIPFDNIKVPSKDYITSFDFEPLIEQNIEA